MDTRLTEIAERIKVLREICDFTVEEMAEAASISVEEYLQYESGTKDFSVTFLSNCAKKFGVDIIELMTGENPHLTEFTVVRKGNGLASKRRAGFKYDHLAFNFKNKIAEPFLVEAPYSEEEQNEPIHLSSHEGQDFDYILSGSLKVDINGHFQVLNAGDAIYYDSSKPHGMIAVNGEKCVFLAFVMPKQGGNK